MPEITYANVPDSAERKVREGDPSHYFNVAISLELRFLGR